MPRKGEPHPLKGIPRSQWGLAKGEDPAPEVGVVPEIPQVISAPKIAPQPEPQYPKLDPQSPPPNLFSGNIARLTLIGRDGSLTDPVPGFATRWFNDENGDQTRTGPRIQMALRSGWVFIERDEVALNEGLVPLNVDLGSHVREIVGKQQNGSPLFAYAMKKPQWLFDLHSKEREDNVNARIESSLRAGRSDKLPADKQYARDISIDTKLYR